MRKLLIFILLVISIQLNATIYYIRTDGSNSNTGTTNSSGGAWRTLTYACSRVSGNGDIIHVVAGTYTETQRCNLAVGVSIEGDGSSSIIKSHYVAGFKNWDEGIIYLDPGTNTGQHISGLYLDGDGLQGDNGIVVNNRSNVTVSNCTIKDFLQLGVRFTGSGTNINNALRNCIISNCSNVILLYENSEAVSLNYQTGFDYDNNDLYNNVRAVGSRGDGMRCWNQVYALKLHDSYFIGDEVVTESIKYPFIIEFWNESHIAGYGTEIYNNEFVGQVDFGSGGGKGSYQYAFYVHHNYFHTTSVHAVDQWTCGLQIEEHVNDVWIANNRFKDFENPIYLCSQDAGQSFNNVWIWNNIFENVLQGYHAFQLYDNSWNGHGQAIQITGSVVPDEVSNIFIWNNTFVASTTGGRVPDCAVWIPSAGYVHDIYIENNIMIGFGEAPILTQKRTSGGTISNVWVRNNNFYNNALDDLLVLQMSITNLTKSGNITGNSLLVSASNLHLQTGSAAIGTGRILSWVTSDYEGNTVNSPPEIGAYKYGTSVTVPVLTTVAISDISTTTAISGGSFSSSGGSAVTAKGVCWSTATNPTLVNSHTTDGTGTAYFVSSLTSLTPATTYYVRAYATNGTGTGYGNNLSFTTSASTFPYILKSPSGVILLTPDGHIPIIYQ